MTHDFDQLIEGYLKNLAAAGLTAGVLGAGGLTYNNSRATPHQPVTSQSQEQDQYHKQKRIAKLRELKILAQQAAANNDERGLQAITAAIRKVLDGK